MANKTKTIMKKHNFPNYYTLYGNKPTGVTLYFQSGNTIDFICKQCRHHDISETIRYLRDDLGLQINQDYKPIIPTF